MILGIGTDITDIARIEHLVVEQGERFLHKCFTAGEIAYAQSTDNMAASLAKRWAGKEAVVKALGTGFGNGLYYRDVEIVSGGQPTVKLHSLPESLAQKNLTIHLSLSDDAGHALAFVIVEQSN